MKMAPRLLHVLACAALLALLNTAPCVLLAQADPCMTGKQLVGAPVTGQRIDVVMTYAYNRPYNDQDPNTSDPDVSGVGNWDAKGRLCGAWRRASPAVYPDFGRLELVGAGTYNGVTFGDQGVLCNDHWSGTQEVSVTVTVLDEPDPYPASGPGWTKGRLAQLSFFFQLDQESPPLTSTLTHSDGCPGFNGSLPMSALPPASADVRIPMHMGLKTYASIPSSDGRGTLQVSLEMSKLSKDDAKKAAAQGAVGMNEAAAVLGAEAAVGGGTAGTFGGKGGGPAAVLGVGSAVAWDMANQYQKLANDPPRDDYQVVSPFLSLQSNIPAAADSDSQAWQAFLVNTRQVVLAVKATIIAIERYHGAMAAVDAGPVKSVLRALHHG